MDKDEQSNLLVTDTEEKKSVSSSIKLSTNDKMGASQERTMSVREKINLVLKDADLDEDDGTSRSTDDSFHEKLEFGGDPTRDRKDGAIKNMEQYHGRQRSSQEYPGNGQKPESKSLMSKAHNMLVEVQMQLQLSLLNATISLEDQLDESETKFNAISTERDQLAIELQSEQEERTRLQQINASLLEQNSLADGSIKEKEDMIIELQPQLLIAKTRRPVEEEST